MFKWFKSEDERFLDGLYAGVNSNGHISLSLSYSENEAKLIQFYLKLFEDNYNKNQPKKLKMKVNGKKSLVYKHADRAKKDKAYYESMQYFNKNGMDFLMNDDLSRLIKRLSLSKNNPWESLRRFVNTKDYYAVMISPATLLYVNKECFYQDMELAKSFTCLMEEVNLIKKETKVYLTILKKNITDTKGLIKVKGIYDEVSINNKQWLVWEQQL